MTRTRKQIEMFGAKEMKALPQSPAGLTDSEITGMSDRPRPAAVVFAYGRELLGPFGITSQESGRIVRDLIRIKDGVVGAFAVLVSAREAWSPVEYVYAALARKVNGTHRRTMMDMLR